jgi:hypothetical protein
MAVIPKPVNPFASRNRVRQRRQPAPTQPTKAQRPDYYGPRAPRVNAPQPTQKQAPTPTQPTRPVSRPTPNMDRYPMTTQPPEGVSYVRVPWQDVWKGKIAPPMNRPVNLPQGQKWETPGVLVETNGGRYYVPETGPQLREPKRTWQPPDYQPTYWEDPHRVARWHNAIQSMPPGWEAPEWLDVDSIEAAYEYMKYTNKDLPWYSWKWLSPTDPGREFLKGLSAPPPEMLWQGEENFGLQHTEPTPWMQQQQAQQAQVPEYIPTTSPEEVGDPSQGGMTDAQWDALPGWQRTMINILNSPVTAGAMGGLPGAMIGLGLGGPIGALVGGAIGAGAGVYSQQNPESSIAQAMMLLDYPRQWFEQGLGTLGQITGAATTPGGEYGNVQDILNNLPSAWQAARLTYEVQGAPFNLIPEWITGVKLKPGETWQLGTPTPVQTGYTGDVDLDALTEARNRIIAGESPETVYQDISSKMGFSGQWRELLSGFVLDPLNAVPWATRAGGKGLATLAGNERLALAFDTTRGLTEAVKTYGNLLRKAPIEEVSKMDGFSKFLAGLDREGNVKYLVNPIDQGGVFNYLTHLTPAARASEVVNNSGIEMAVLLERAGDNPSEMIRLIHSVANTPDDLARELGMQSLKSADAAAIPMALKDFGTKADEHLAAWEASRWQRTVVENIAQVTGKKAEKVIQELNQGDPELLLKQFIEKAKTMEGDAAKALVTEYESGELTGLKLKSIIKGFAQDNVPYTADMFRANLYADLMEHTADWGAKWFGVKPDPTWLRLSNTVKSAQSMLLLGLNPNYMVNNALNNIVTMAIDGVLGTRTTRQIEDIWTRALGGTQPARLKSKALPFDLGESTSAPIRAAQQMPGMLTDIQDFFRTKTKKFQVFGNISAEIEGLSSQQAYTSGFVQAWNRLWKRGTGFERMPAALEQQLNAIDPHLGELIYGAIQGGMNKQEVEKALWSGVIKRNAGSAVPEIIRRTGMSEADVNEALTHAGMFEPEFADLLSNAKGNDEIINLINQRELKVQDYLDKITASNLEGEAARIAGTVKSEGLQGALKIYDDMSYADSREWMEHTAHMTHMMETAADMEPGERNAYIRGEQQKARQEWNRTNVRRKNQYLAISNGLGLDSETGRRITGYLTEHEENWKGFYKYRDEVMDRYFNTEFENRDQRLAAWNALQDDLQRRYKDTGQTRNEIQTRMDKEFVDLFAANYGEEAGKTAAKWRKGIRDINDRMEREMYGFRDSIRKMPAEEKRLAWLDFNQKSRYKDMADLYTENMQGAMEVYEYLTGKRPSGAGAATPPEPPPQIPEGPVSDYIMPPGNHYKDIENVVTMVQRQTDEILSQRLRNINKVASDKAIQLRTRIADYRLEGQPDWVEQVTTILRDSDLKDGELKYLMQKENQDLLTQHMPISAVTEKGAADPAAAVFIERYPGIGKQQTGQQNEVSTAFMEKTAENARVAQQIAEVHKIARDNGLDTRASILALVHKYGGAEGQDANYVEDITPAVMRRAVEAKAAEAATPPPIENELTNVQRHANQIRNMVNEGDYNGALSNVRRVTDPAVREAIFEAVPEFKTVVEKGDALTANIFANNLDAVPPEIAEAVTRRYHDLGMEAEIGEAGWRRMIDKDEWVSQKSTYPDWYKEIYKSASYDGKSGKAAVIQAAKDLSTRQVKTKAGGTNYRVVDDLIQEAAASLEIDNPTYRKALGYQFDFDQWENQLYKLTTQARETDLPDALSNMLGEEVKALMDELPEDAPDLYMQRLGNLQEYILNKLEPSVDENPMAPDVQQMETGKVSQAGWGEDVRQFAPEADVQAVPITPEIHMAQVRRDLKAAFIERFLSGQEEVLSGAWSAEQQAEAVLGILDARARAWAKRTGRTAAEWYATRIEGVGDTPADVQNLLQSMPRAPKGAVDFTADGRAVIYALQSPDVTTLVHEIGHIFRRDLDDADLDAAAKWGGLTDAAEMRQLEKDVMAGKLKPEDANYQSWSKAEEKFAYGFERYLKDGIAPTPELGNLFEQFKDWISQIYARLRSSMVNDLTPEMRGVYDRLLTESDAGDFPIQTETGRARVQNPSAYIRELLTSTTEEQAAKIMQEGLGTTPKEGGGTLFQLPTEEQPIWYSALENGVAGIPMERMTVAQMRGMLQKAGVKPDEMKWTGFDEWLGGRESVTKAEALDYLKQNGVQVEEVVKPGGEKPTYWLTYPDGQRFGQPYSSEADARLAIAEALPADTKVTVTRGEESRVFENTKYSQYTLPGGENYREMLMTLPRKIDPDSARKYYETFVRTGGGPGWDELTQAQRDMYAAPSYGRNEPGYQSSHWQEPNVLAHVRFNDRVDADGKKVLFIEEIQSDWHQAGREKGYKQPLTEAVLPEGWKLERTDAEDNYAWVIRDGNGDFWGNDSTREGALAQLGRKEEGVPPAPFAKTWPELSMKRMIQWASENGYDRIAWTTGEQQAERYNLANQVRAITWYKNPDGTFDLGAILKDTGTEQSLQKGIGLDRVADYVGKDIAKKIEVEPPDKFAGTYTGVDLKVGGEGMKAFYDRMLPEAMDKYIKKWGGKVGETRIPDTKAIEEARLRWNENIGPMARAALKKLETEPPTYTVHSFDVTPPMRESVLTRGQPLFQATFEDGRTVPIPDEQQPSPAINMLGSTDTIQPAPPLDRMQEEGWKQWEPIFDEMKGYFTNKERQTPGSVLNQVLDEDTARALKAYMGNVYGQMADTKLAAIKSGEMKRDMALLNYSQRTGFDNVLGAGLPYSFWTTHSAVNWAMRAIDRPALMANYARIRNFQNNVVNTKGFPTRLKNKMKIPMPFLPDWAGDGIYIDPFKQIFPFENITRPFEQWQAQRTQEQRRAETILQMWVEDEQMDATTAQQAIQSHQGDAWDKAVAQAKLDTEGEISNPLDFAFLMSGPSLPIGWLYNVAKGTPEKISQLPVTKMIQSATALMGANKGRGVNIEGPIRKALGLPERDWLQDYRVERMLANMTAEGKLTSNQAIQAMIDKTGPYYQEAEARVAKSGALSFFGGFTGADLFPEGEAEQRGLKNEYDTAIAAYEAGQTDALTKFWDAHPEYEARRAMGQDPEKRMRQFLISQVWDGWNNAQDLTKRDLTEGLGNLFQDNFLNKETRSYDTIDTDTLAMWAKVMGGTVPEAAGNVPTLPINITDPQIVTQYQDYQDQRDQYFPGIGRLESIYYGIPEGEGRDRWAAQHPELDEYNQWKNAYFAQHPEIIQYAIGEDNKVAGQKPEIQAKYYQFQAYRDSQFPGIFDKQDEYFSLPEKSAERKAYLEANPDLPAYWDWRKQYMAQYPDMIPYLMSTESLAQKVLGADYQPQTVSAPMPEYTQEYNNPEYLSDQELGEFTPALIRQVMGHFYANQQIGSGAQKELRRIYNMSGRKMSFDEWIDVVIKNTFGLQRENILQ